jgi:hypothetical protein
VSRIHCEDCHKRRCLVCGTCHDCAPDPEIDRDECARLTGDKAERVTR